MGIAIKRAYQKVEKEDGQRILVDRLWPRGVAKQDLAIDLWLKEVAPSSELRKWFNHDPKKFNEFKQKYQQELQEDQEKQAALQEIKQLNHHHDQVTLVYAAKDEIYNHAVVLKETFDE
ncbi:DUF488 domain-containing protein [Paraliobacillus ryukyuensis]|uniref:DUF488 domain-containing protein n=1 Tax=Paraliobacillus ryukyuensis TaxID=200904 RepID=UPI0009A83D1E|nr:DUF488 domain-containing protein [Paraliobacillus ryukyuensis]